MYRTIATLAANLKGGFRLLTLARVGPGDFGADTLQVLALLGLHLMLRGLADLVLAWPPSQLLGYGVGLALLPLVIAMAWVEGVARWRRIQAAIPALTVAILAPGLWAELCWMALANLVPWALLPPYAGFVLSVGVVFLWGLAGYRALRLIGAQGVAVAALAGLALPVAMIAAGMVMGRFAIFLGGPRG